MDKIPSLKEFDLKSLRPDSTILVYGKRRSGKSFLVRDIFYHHRHIPLGLVFSATEEANTFFGHFIPDTFIHSEFDSEMISNLIMSQSKKIKECKTVVSDGKTRNNRAFLVLDDMLADSGRWKRDKTIREIFFNGRHFNIFFILTMQYPIGIPPELRTNIDYIFIFNESSVKNRKKLYDEYAGMIPSYKLFCSILDECTKDHKCLVIKAISDSHELKKQIFWYKADLRDNFKVGHPMLWSYHSDKYNEKYNDNRENIKISVSRKDGKVSLLKN